MRAALLLLFVVACQPPPAKKPQPQPSDDGSPAVSIFRYARPYIAREEPPARFAAALPDTVAALSDTGRYPPEAAITAALARGDKDMQRRVREAVTKAAWPTLPTTLTAFYDRVFGVRPTAAACDYLLAQVTGAVPRRARAPFWAALSRCRGSRYAEAFTRDDAPDSAVVRWHALAEEEVELTERLGVAALAVARRGPLEAREVGDALARVGGRKAVRAVRQLQNRLRDPERKAWVALGLARRSEERARSMVRRACTHPRVRFDPACSGIRWTALDLRGDVRAVEVELEQLVSAHGEESVVEELVACVEEGEWDDERLRCLRRLSALDWERAAAVAATIQESLVPSSLLAPHVGRLVRFPEPGGIAGRLRELGLLGADEQTDATFSAADILVAHGRAIRLEAHAGTFPAGHVDLASQLAELVRPDLDRFDFDTELPEVAGPFRLRAWGCGRLYEVPAGRAPDWLDVPAVVGLLNALLRAQKSEQRVLTLAGGGSMVTVVGAPAEALEAAVDAGLFSPR